MVRLEVKNGKIETRMVSDPSGYPIYEEVGQGVAELLAEFQAEAIRHGNSEEQVRAAFQEMMNVIMANNDALVRKKRGNKTTDFFLN